MNEWNIPVKREVPQMGIFPSSVVCPLGSVVYRNIPSEYAEQVSLATNIRSARQAAKFTQDDLGQRVGVGQGAVSKWETGETEPSSSLLPRIAVATHRTLDELCKGVDTDYDRLVAAETQPQPLPDLVRDPLLLEWLNDGQRRRDLERFVRQPEWVIHGTGTEAPVPPPDDEPSEA